ncbi:MAG: glycosyltransferase family 4 protein [Planctomycetota bacterium]
MPEVFEDRLNIGCWHWELSKFPAVFDKAFQYVHEVWVPSSFAQKAIAQRSPVPVIVMPHCIEAGTATPEARKALGLPEGGFLVLVMFDMQSYFERKNPLGAIEAFRRAFRPEDKATLVVKVQHGASNPQARDALQRAINAGAILVDAVLSREDTLALVGACDVYLSLHRSEGFGLTIAEAMAMGKPVVATAYSGNMDFMGRSNAYPVDYRSVEIERDVGPYPAGCVWADPDVEQASHLLRRIVDEPDGAREVGRRAQEDIARELCPRRIGTLYRERLVLHGLLSPASGENQ